MKKHDFLTLVAKEVDNWYNSQSFEVLHKIHDIDCLFDLHGWELEKTLGTLESNWHEYDIQDKLGIYIHFNKE